MNKFDDLVLGITDTHGYTHDNSIALLKKGRILFAVSEERYTRIKHDGSFPKKSILAALKYLKIKSSSIKTIAVGYPKRKILSVLYNKYFYEIIPFVISILTNRNFRLLRDSINILKLLHRKSTENRQQDFLEGKKIVFVDHHLSHAASAYYCLLYTSPSPRD